MSEKKPVVIMTVSGRVKELPAEVGIRSILQEIYDDLQHAGSAWDRPDKLFIGGKCTVNTGLADIAYDFGKFRSTKEDELDVALREWIKQRFPGSEAA